MSLPRRLGPRSLTGRLVSWVCALVVVLVALIGTATYFAERSFLYNRLDQQLAPIAVSNAQQISGCPPLVRCQFRSPGPYRAALTEWITVLDTEGKNMLSLDQPTSALEPMALDRDLAVNIAAAGDTVRTVTTADGEKLRVQAIPIARGRLVVVTGLSADEVDKPLRRLVGIELIVGVIAVAVAISATTFAVRFSLRGLRRVTTTAQDVAAELSPGGAGLDRRVPMPDESTEVGQLAGSMNTLLGAVETQFAARLESEHRMRRFLADASHELRTPLTSIRGFAELARMQRGTGVDAEDNLDRIESEGTRMSRLVDDLLVLARGDSAARPGEPELVDLDGLLDEAAHSAQAAFPERAIDVETHPMQPVLGDRDQLLRVVRNLVTNAAVHTQADRPIHILGGPHGAGVIIQVVDGGPGLPPEQAAHVFERFWRADRARSRASGGSGLGLSIVDSIVRAHGGSVHFESTVERGSTVTVWLPVAPAMPGHPG
jgi:two-component system OmpR family sensor kinase